MHRQGSEPASRKTPLKKQENPKNLKELAKETAIKEAVEETATEITDEPIAEAVVEETVASEALADVNAEDKPSMTRSIEPSVDAPAAEKPKELEEPR